jgi:hypothetical protein
MTRKTRPLGQTRGLYCAKDGSIGTHLWMILRRDHWVSPEDYTEDESIAEQGDENDETIADHYQVVRHRKLFLKN